MEDDKPRSIHQSEIRLDYAKKIAPGMLDSHNKMVAVGVFGSTVGGGENFSARDSDLDMLTVWPDDSSDQDIRDNSRKLEEKHRDGKFYISITTILQGNLESPKSDFQEQVKDTVVILARRS